MKSASLRQLLQKVSSGEVSPEEAAREIAYLPFSDLGFAKVDHHRELRSGVAEAVFGEGKTPSQVSEIVEDLLGGSNASVIVTRSSPEQYEAVREAAPEAHFDAVARVIVARGSSEAPAGVYLVVSAGTSDGPVAQEAIVVAEALGLKVESLTDVGVAGVHRLLADREALERADVISVVAGMDGALASVVAGLVSVPVIAVPTSVGYGAGAGGITPLLTMLNSCAPGIAVVNIDNGFGAAVYAATILQR
jgi:hypothetical protein